MVTRSIEPAQETADAKTVPYELELRLVTGDASRALGRLLAQGSLTPSGASSLRKAATTIRNDASNVNGTGSVGAAHHMNLLTAAAVAFSPQALEGLGHDLNSLADELDAIADKRLVDEPTLRDIDNKLLLLRKALARSGARRQPSEQVSL